MLGVFPDLPNGARITMVSGIMPAWETTVRSALATLSGGRIGPAPPTVAVVRLAGPIGQVGPFRRGVSLAGIADSIERAFRLRNLKAVALAINSPGGSPVQSALIAARIRALALEKHIPVFAFAEDVAASGGYWLALAADEIYADENSIVGSIGVISTGFGLADFIKRFGIERRLYAAGERKSLLDPFLEEKPEDVARLRAVHEDIHESFRRIVKERRGAKLKAPDSELFSGEFWTGRRALERGLVDGIGDLRSVMRARYGDDVKLKPVGARGFRWRIPTFGVGSRGMHDPALWTSEAIAAVEERLLWNRFGL